LFTAEHYNSIEKDDDKFTFDWKNFFRAGFQIQQNWTNLSVNQKTIIPNFQEDCTIICGEIYHAMKGK
jgi:hypothetical protein